MEEAIECSICKSGYDVTFVAIADCFLCKKCDDELLEGFEEAMKMDRTGLARIVKN